MLVTVVYQFEGKPLINSELKTRHLSYIIAYLRINYHGVFNVLIMALLLVILDLHNYKCWVECICVVSTLSSKDENSLIACIY